MISLFSGLPCANRPFSRPLDRSLIRPAAASGRTRFLRASASCRGSPPINVSGIQNWCPFGGLRDVGFKYKIAEAWPPPQNVYFSNSPAICLYRTMTMDTVNTIKLDHCVIHVSDWERSTSFYREVVGAQPMPVGKGFAYRFGETQLNCHGPNQIGSPRARLPVMPGGSDLCFEWPGPIEGAIGHLQQHGIEESSAPSNASAHAVQVPAFTFVIRTDRSWSSSVILRKADGAPASSGQPRDIALSFCWRTCRRSDR
jgi:catechol 2,3-dioxygenase-like lactoylglutathione lyase family enzyme